VPTSRRRFLSAAGAALAAAAARADEAKGGAPGDKSVTPTGTAAAPPPPGTPPAFGTAPAVGPEVTPATFAEAGKLVRVESTPKDAAQMAGNWRESVAGLTERRSGPRKLPLPDDLHPAMVWNPVLPGTRLAPTKARFVRSAGKAGPLPASDAELAFAPVTSLSRWLESKQLTSTRLTRLYLERLERFQPKLNCVVTLTVQQALDEAAKADAELRAGKRRGPLHGIPYGVKDLLDTAGIRTTWGAEPFVDRVPARDAAVVARLREAGAVLVAKLSLGALALNDVWFGGETKNPWCAEEGSGGSSAGPAAATSAGLVGFAIGSETGGSIIGPSMRCGVTGLRPTFGRVPRTGAMTLCWSLDKLGPMTRTVEDALLVLAAIEGPDQGDLASLPFGAQRLSFDASLMVKGLKVGFVNHWQEEPPATAVDRAALDALRGLGCEVRQVTLPDWPYNDLSLILFAEAAAAFEELTLSHGVDKLKMQVPDAWPNLFRQSRFLSAVDFVQADRLRRKVAQEMARLFGEVDVLLVPSLRDEMLTISNFTGHPSLTVKAGFVEVEKARSDWAPDPARPLSTFSPPRRLPYGVTLLGRLFDEGTLGRLGLRLERAMGVSGEVPPGFE
jgi:Asp-tRNA(Asn)/Glu-tRNA(Gln) amidotransferase A subunit family amidase